MREITLDIPEDDDSHIESWCVKVQARMTSTGNWEFVDGWLDSLTLKLGLLQLDNGGNARFTFRSPVVPIDRVDIESYRREIAEWIEDRFWDECVRELDKQLEIA